MTAFSGSFHGKTTWQAMAAMPDVANHELSLIEIRGKQTCTDPKWNDAAITYWGMLDLTSGNGGQQGYFLNEHADGDRDWGSFESKVTTSGEQTTLDGTWQITGGSGNFQGISGRGTFKGQMTSATEIATEWEGDYQL